MKNTIRTSIRLFLEKTGLLEKAQIIKAALRRKMRRKTPSGPPVFPGPKIDNFYASHLGELYIPVSGPDAAARVEASTREFFDAHASVLFEYEILSCDSRLNWLRLEREKFSSPVDMTRHDGLMLWIKPSGAGGEFRFSLIDEEAGEWFFSDLDILSKNEWTLLYMPFREFYQPSWALKGNGRKSFRKVTTYSFSVARLDRPVPLRGHLYLSGLRYLDFADRQVDRLTGKFMLKDVVVIDDFTGDVEDRFSPDHGPGARISFRRDLDRLLVSKPSLRIEYSIDSSDSTKNWAVLRRASNSRYIEFSDSIGLALWVRSEKVAGEFRLVLRDENNREWVSSSKAVPCGDEFEPLFFPLTSFTSPPWLGPVKSAGRIERIKQIEFFFGPDVHTIPHENIINIANLCRVRRVEFWDEPEEGVSGLLLFTVEKGLEHFDKLAPEDFFLLACPGGSAGIRTSEQDGKRVFLIDYSIPGTGENRWVVLHRKLTSPVQPGITDGLLIRLSSRADSPPLEIRLVDEEGTEFVSSDTRIVSFEPCSVLYIPLGSFAPADCKKLSEIKITEYKLVFGAPPGDGFFRNHVRFSGIDFCRVFSRPRIHGDLHFQKDASVPEEIRPTRLEKPSRKIRIGNELVIHSSSDLDGIDDEVRQGAENSQGRLNLHDSRRFESEKACTATIGQSEPDRTPSVVRDSSGRVIFKIGRRELFSGRTSDIFGLERVAMFVEPTNLCNLRCIMCNHGDSSFRRPLGVMKFKDFRTILEDIEKTRPGLWEFAPYWLGESFVHPQIGDFLERASQARSRLGTFRSFNIHTNGACLEDKHLDMILESRLDSILFSIDAASAGTYTRIRRGGRFDRVVETVETLLRRRNQSGERKPAIIVQFIVMDENAHEIKAFADFWKARGIEELIYAGREEDNPFNTKVARHLLFPMVGKDCIFIKALEPNALTKHQIHREAIPHPEDFQGKRWACASLWRMLSVSWDGDVTACCRDDGMEMPIGNVFRTGISEIWYGERLKQQRLQHILGDFSGLKKCATCYNWVKNPMPLDEIEKWLETVGESSLFADYRKRMQGKASKVG